MNNKYHSEPKKIIEPLSTAFTSEVMDRILNQIMIIARTDQNVLIVGEVGSGKEWTARTLHNASLRANEPFCVYHGITPNQLEVREELFGQMVFTMKGAKVEVGLISKANRGTLFIDELNAVPHEPRIELANIMEGKPSGNGLQVSSSLDVRLIGAVENRMYRNLSANPEWQEFITKLQPTVFYQPALRDHREDIPKLIDRFLYLHSTEKSLSPKALYRCISYPWPGNIRQLKNAIEHADLVSRDPVIRTKHLPESIRKYNPEGQVKKQLENDRSFQRTEKILFQLVIQKAGSVKEAAQQIDLPLEEFRSKIHQYNVGEEIFQSEHPNPQTSYFHHTWER